MHVLCLRRLLAAFTASWTLCGGWWALRQKRSPPPPPPPPPPAAPLRRRQWPKRLWLRTGRQVALPRFSAAGSSRRCQSCSPAANRAHPPQLMPPPPPPPPLLLPPPPPPPPRYRFKSRRRGDRPPWQIWSSTRCEPSTAHVSGCPPGLDPRCWRREKRSEEDGVCVCVVARLAVGCRLLTVCRPPACRSTDVPSLCCMHQVMEAVVDVVAALQATHAHAHAHGGTAAGVSQGAAVRLAEFVRNMVRLANAVLHASRARTRTRWC
jgi:hypothetical protein